MSTLTINQYVRELQRAGQHALAGRGASCWRQQEVGSLMRIPTFDLSVPDSGEIRNLFLNSRTAVVSYLAEPDLRHQPNAFLYVCRDHSYSLEKLHETVRRHIRRANKTLHFSWVDKLTLQDQGFPAFRDSKLRNGLSHCTPESFRIHFCQWLDNPAHRILGAWKDDTLIAFFKVTTVEDWVEIGAYSANEGLEFRPNNGLFDYALTYFLVEQKFSVVTYGLSSIQEQSNADSLHQFKIKIGFEAVPVHRRFILHPLLRPFANRLSLAVGHGLLKVSPGNRVLRKGVGVLARLVNANSDVN
jgi:hypothetical protein